MSDQVRTGAQILQERSDAMKQAQENASDLALRKWCVERAIESTPSGASTEVAKKIYDFVTNKEKTNAA